MFITSLHSRYSIGVMVMTGHSKSPEASPNMLDGEKTNGSAMHTLAPARSPNQPLLHHLQVSFSSSIVQLFRLNIIKDL